MSLRSITQIHGYTGVVSTYGDLLNVTGSPNQNAYLRQGDQAYVSTEKMWYLCDVDTLGGAVWVPADSGGMRRSYGDTHIHFSGSSFPSSAGQVQFVMGASGGNRHFITSFAPYALCTSRVKVYDSGGALLLTTDTKFADHAEIASWIDTNVPVGYFATMEVFDIIDNSIVPLAKVYGKNRLWTTLSSPRALSSPRSHKSWSMRNRHSFFPVAGSSGLPTGVLTPVMQGMLISMFPAHPSWGGAFNMNGPKEMGTFWVSPMYKNRYDMPGFRPESCLVVNGGTGAPDRWSWDGTGFSPAPLGDYRYDTNSTGPHYLALDAGAGTADFFTADEGMRKRLGGALLDGASVLLCYPMVNKEGDSRAVYVKPVGIDQVFFNQYDDSLYRIEAVGTHRNDRRPRLLPLQIPLNNPSNRSAGPVGIYEFIAPLTAQQWNGHFPAGRHSHTSGLARFQLRDVNTGKVSPLSSAELTTVARKRGRPVSWLIKNKSDY